MSEDQNTGTDPGLQDRKARIILMGAGLGAVFGLITSYLYTRAAEESENAAPGAEKSVSTGQLLAVFVAVLGLARQIAELGKSKEADKGAKK